MHNPNQRQAFIDRRPSMQLTPEYEDFGLFKSDVLPVEVNLAPIIYRNGRQDLVVRGYAQKKQKFEVTFAGRRSAMAGPLIANLDALKKSFVKQLKGKTIDALDLESLRISIMIEGAWRRRHWTDGDGWQCHVNQLVAARWSIQADDGRLLTFGVSPSHAVRLQSPVVGYRGPGEGGHIEQPARGD